MKVLHVIDRLAVGGAEKVFVRLTDLLSDYVDVMIFNSGYPLESELNKDITVHYLKRKNKYNPNILYKAHQISKQYDIVHTHLRHVHAYMKMAKLLFRGKYKLILHDHGGVSNKVPFRLKGRFKPSHYIGVNDKQVEWAIKKLGVRKENVFQLTNVVAKINPAEHSKDGSLMMIANIRRVKNIEFAIAIAKQMSRRLTIYGNVLDDEYYKELQSVIDCDDNIKIVQGVTDFRTAYQNHNVAIHTSKSETGPLVLLEYMQAGIPFVSYNIGDIAAKLYRELPDLFVNSFDMTDWISQLQTINDTDWQAEKIRALYHQYYNPEQIKNKCLEIYKSVYS